MAGEIRNNHNRQMNCIMNDTQVVHSMSLYYLAYCCHFAVQDHVKKERKHKIPG